MAGFLSRSQVKTLPRFLRSRLFFQPIFARHFATRSGNSDSSDIYTQLKELAETPSTRARSEADDLSNLEIASDLAPEPTNKEIEKKETKSKQAKPKPIRAPAFYEEGLIQPSPFVNNVGLIQDILHPPMFSAQKVEYCVTFRFSSNNIFATFHKVENGHVVTTKTPGVFGYEGRKRAGRGAANDLGLAIANVIKFKNVDLVGVIIKGYGSRTIKKTCIAGIIRKGIRVAWVIDRTPIPHGGCRLPKKARGYARVAYPR